MNNLFDPTKPVQTRDGKPVRVLCTDANLTWGLNTHPIVALVSHDIRDELVRYFENGKLLEGTDSNYDLVNIPEVTKKYYRTYYTVGNGASDNSPQVTSSAEVSEQAARDNRNTARMYNYIGILEYVFTDGVVTDVNFIPW